MNIYKNIKHPGLFKLYLLPSGRMYLGHRYQSENMYTGEVKNLKTYHNSKSPKSWTLGDFYIVATR